MKWNFLVLLALCATWILSGCDKSTTASGTSDDTHSSINITGRVFTDQSKPLGAVIVHLRHANLSDTTDGDGKFAIQGERSTLSARAMATVDTLDYLRNGNTIQSVAVISWVYSMPDLFLVQRDIFGKINPSQIRIAKITGTLWNAQGDSFALSLEWNSLTDRYSGFAWFRCTGGVDSFQVQVNTFDSLGRKIGSSPKMPFTSLAGNIQMPDFNADNTLPWFTFQVPPTIHRLDSARIRMIGQNPLDSTLRIQWNIDGHAWVDGRTDTLLWIPDQCPDSLVIGARAIQKNGLMVTYSVYLTVTSFRQKVSLSIPLDTVPSTTNFKVHFTDSDTLGSTPVKRWLGAPWNVEVSGQDTILTAPYTFGPVDVQYWVRNTRGDSVMASNSIWVSPGTPQDFAVTVDSLYVHASWKNPDQSVYQWRLTLGDSAGNVVDTFVFNGKTSSATLLRTYAQRTLRANLAMKVLSMFVDTTTPMPDTTILAAEPDFTLNFEHPATAASWPWGNMNLNNKYGLNAVFSGSSELWPNQFGYPAWLITHNGDWDSAISGKRLFDPVFQSNAIRFDFNSTQPQSYYLNSLAMPISGWQDVKSLSVRLRGSDSSQFFITLWAPSLESYYAANWGYSLGWMVKATPNGAVLNLPMDSLQWSSTIAPTGMTLPTFTEQEILAKASLLAVEMRCDDPPGNPCRSLRNQFLVIDDIKFNR